MIRFEVNTQSYYVEWKDLPYDRLYMVYCPAGVLMRIVNGQIEFLPPGRDRLYIVCPKTAGHMSAPHPHEMPNGLYSVRLCTDPSGENCEILGEKEIYLGHKICVRYGMNFSAAGKKGFADLIVKSECFIPRDQIWISYNAFVENENRILDAVEPGIRIFLPEMQREEKGGFVTKCLIPESGYRYAGIAVSGLLSDCVRVIRH